MNDQAQRIFRFEVDPACGVMVTENGVPVVLSEAEKQTLLLFHIHHNFSQMVAMQRRALEATDSCPIHGSQNGGRA